MGLSGQVPHGVDAATKAPLLGLLDEAVEAERLARRRAQRTLILADSIVTITGTEVLLSMVIGSPNAWAFAPGLLLSVSDWV